MAAIEKVAVYRITKPEHVRALPDSELLNLHRRLHQLDAILRRYGRPREYFTINRHVWVVEEMRRRNFHHHTVDDLDRETERLLSASSPVHWLEEHLSAAEEVVLVPHYVSIVGSAVEEQNPRDLDVLLREDERLLSKGWRESVLLAVRQLLDPEKTGLQLHLVCNPQGPHLIGDRGYIPVYDLVLRPRKQLEILRDIEPLTPLSRYTVQKPLMAGVTDFVSTQELWERWASKAAEVTPLYASPKVDGYRLILGKDENGQSRAYLEDMGEDHSGELELLLSELPPGTLVEGELCVLYGNEWLARPQIASYLAGRIEGVPYCFLYDILVANGEDIHSRPFEERYPVLQKLATDHLVVLPQEVIRSAEELERAAKRLLAWSHVHGGPPIEGLVVRRADMPYVFGPTQFYAKWKIGIELKVEVVAVHRKRNGWTYTGALRDGERRVVLGDTFVTKEKLADVGDTLNVLVEELVIDNNDTLSWGKPSPQGVDRSRPAYTVRQAIDLARRYGVLKQYVDVDASADDNEDDVHDNDAYTAVNTRVNTGANGEVKTKVNSEINSEASTNDETDAGGETRLSNNTGGNAIAAAKDDIEKFAQQTVTVIPWEHEMQKQGEEEEQEDERPVYRPFFRSIGSLWSYVQELLPLLPAKIERLVEPFGGNGTLIWVLDPPEGAVIADSDESIIRLFRICRDLTPDDYRRLRSAYWIGDKDYYAKLYDGPEPEDDIEWFYRELYLYRFSSHGRWHKDFRLSNLGQKYRWEKRVRAAQKRLRQNVTLEVADFRETLEKYDQPGTFFFLDPPWPKQGKRYYRHAMVSVEEIADAVRKVRHADVMIVIQGDQQQLRPLRELGWIERKFPITHSWAAVNTEDRKIVRRRSWVSVFMNYEPVQKQESKRPDLSEETETRGELALRHWEEHWHEAMPLSGKPQPFIVQAHVRGLTAEEARLVADGTWGLQDILEHTNHSLHFDMRLATDRGNFWWGITLFAGTMQENLPQLRLYRMQHDPDVRFESAPKLFGPMAWFKVGVGKPMVVPPSGVGSTSRAWSAFFAIEQGTYQLGFARQHAVELYLDGEHLKGRFVWQYADFGGRRAWIFTRPRDQAPYAAKHNLEEVVKQVRERNQRYLVWPKDPNDLSAGHRLIDVEKLKRLIRSIPERRYTLAVAFPLNEVDAHGDIVTSLEELENAAWNFLQRRRKVGLMHQPGTEGAGEVVESYIYRGPRWEINGEVVEPGDWLLGVVWREDAWQKIKDGHFTGYSIQGWGKRAAPKRTQRDE